MNIYANGITLHYTVEGTGAPLLLVHGNGENLHIFDEAVSVLKEHFTCYALDSRGHGESSPVAEYHYRDMADDVIAFLDALDLTDVTYYGFSDGGIVGLLAAPQTPRISRLIVSGANVSPAGAVLWLRILFRLQTLFRKNPLVTLMQTEPDISDEWLSGIRVPTLVLAGEHDLIRESETRHIARMIPGSALKILPGEGHGSYIVHSTKIADEILSFCRR